MNGIFPTKIHIHASKICKIKEKDSYISKQSHNNKYTISYACKGLYTFNYTEYVNHGCGFMKIVEINITRQRARQKSSDLWMDDRHRFGYSHLFYDL